MRLLNSGPTLTGCILPPPCVWLQALKMAVVPRQVERLFDIVDRNNDGLINYQEFIRAFDSETPIPRVRLLGVGV